VLRLAYRRNCSERQVYCIEALFERERESLCAGIENLDLKCGAELGFGVRFTGQGCHSRLAANSK